MKTLGEFIKAKINGFKLMVNHPVLLPVYIKDQAEVRFIRIDNPEQGEILCPVKGYTFVKPAPKVYAKWIYTLYRRGGSCLTKMGYQASNEVEYLAARSKAA